jgi:nucleoporin GLE1
MAVDDAGEQTLFSHSQFRYSHSSSQGLPADLEGIAIAHKVALDAAQEEHTRVRKQALRAFEIHELKEKREKLLIAKQQEAESLRLEHERLRLEDERAKLAQSVIEARKKTIPVPEIPKSPPPKPASPPPPPAASVNGSAPAPNLAADSTTQNQPGTATSSTQPTPIVQPQARAQSPPTTNNVTNGVHQSASSALQTTSPTLPQGPPPSPAAQRYLEIHKNLKQLRELIKNASLQDATLKKHVGEMRREIRKSVGQLTGGTGANKIPVRLLHVLSKL